MGSEWPEYMIRICDMQEILDRANYLLDNKGDLKERQPLIEKLEAYYTSQQWKDDFALDEDGELPDSLKRGVLSEDGIYNVLERFNDLKRDQNSD